MRGGVQAPVMPPPTAVSGDIPMGGGVEGSKTFTLKPLNEAPHGNSTTAGGWGPPPVVWSSFSEDVSNVQDTRPGDCHVSVIGEGAGAPAAYLTALMNPVMHHMTRNLHAPKFDDSAENWPGFMWDFEEYCQKLSPSQPILDAYKLRLFEDALPVTLKNELKLLRKSQGNLTFPEVVARFEARYGCGGTTKLRKKWLEVSMPTAGKITTRQLREFQVNFLACADEVRDATPQEVRRQLMQKIPPFMKTWVVEMEQKKEREHPIVQLTFVDGLTEANILAMVQGLIGQVPDKVQIIGRGVYRITFGTKDAAKKLLALHMRELREFPQPLKVQSVEQLLTTLEIFEVINEKLVGRERVDMHNTVGEKQTNAVQIKKSPQEKFVREPPRVSEPAREVAGGRGNVRVPASVPANPLYSAGFEITTPLHASHTQQEPYYPFKSWRDRVSTGKGGDKPNVAAPVPSAPAGGKGGGRGSGPNWRPAEASSSNNPPSRPAPAPQGGGGSGRPNSA